MLSSNVEPSKDLGSNNPSLDVDVANVDNSHVTENNTISEPEKTPPDEPRNQNLQKSLYSKMYILGRELCFLMCLFLTYAAFQNNTPKTSKSPNAFPFFSPDSKVKDWYRGQLNDAIDLASESDLAFIMYYAPWDAESQAVRHEFNIASQHMHKYIHFAAINCWQPESECRLQYSKVYSWPVLMAYPAHGRGIQYKGPRKAEHMLKFLQSISKPFTRITTLFELTTFRSYYDAVVIGYVDAKLGSADYGVLYNTALRFLERDPLREIQFVVVTGESASEFTMAKIPTLELVMWNETLKYPTYIEWRPETIMSWISASLHQVTVWASPSGGKSQSLAPYLQPGPALILFTPRNPLYDLIDHYNVLHEVAMEYYNCDDNMAIVLQKLILLADNRFRDSEHKELLKKCVSPPELEIENIVPVVTYDIQKLWLNNTCTITNKLDMSVCPDISKYDKSKCEKVVHLHPGHLWKNPYKKSSKENLNRNQTNDEFQWISMLTGEGDPRSPANLQRLNTADKCHYLNVAHRLQPALFTPNIASWENVNDNVTGMACKTNMSLSFLALDSLQNHHFAEGLGIDILNRNDKTAVVIINSKLETHHVMMEPYSAINLRIFIRKFSSGVLDRILSTTAIPRIKTHGYQNHYHNKTSLAVTGIKELTTKTFLPSVMQPEKAVVILYYSVKCAFCSGVAHSLLAIARLLQPVKRLQFARIDGDSHALPWEFTMHHFPTILFFPARRKSESRVFPQNVPITIPNILSFILANVESEMRLHIIWILCNQTKYEQELQSCGRTLRLEGSSLVGKMLREYRSASNARDRAAVFKRLQHMRLLQFLFTNSMKQQSSTVQKHMTMVYSNYQKIQ